MKKIYLLFGLVFFIVTLVSLLLKGIHTLPAEGDSVNMHIPIAKSILSGNFFYLDKNGDIFYPAATETLLSLFIVLKIPLNLFNVIGIIFSFVFSVILGIKVGLEKKMAIWMGLSIFFLYGISRWSLTQKPDIWMLNFFILILIFYFIKVKRDIDYFWFGISAGAFIGSKFTGPVFMFVTLIFFHSKFFTGINFKRIIFFIIPVFMIGVFWYVRNYIVTGNPFYFQGYSATSLSTSDGLLAWHAWQSILFHARDMLDALISEFMLWSVGIILVPIFALIHREEKKMKIIIRLAYVSILFFIIYLFLPASDNLTQMIGSLRYVFPAIYLIILSIFIIGAKYKINDFIIAITFSNIVVLMLPEYHPKLIFFIFPLLLLLDFIYKNFHLKQLKSSIRLQ